MRYSLLVLSLLIFLCSCAKQVSNSSAPSAAEEKQGSCSKLPVAISYIMPSSWLRAESKGVMSFEERIIDPVTQSKFKAFYFEGMQGKTQENLARWKNQFAESDRELVSERVLTDNDLVVTELVMRGTFLDRVRKMDPNSEVISRPSHSLQGYIVETQTGTWFFKAVAPSNVIENLAAKFESFAQSIKET